MKSNNHKLLIKNTIFLYLRTFIILLVSLYTSRIILEVLGVEDFGIYNIVAGVVILFSFINNSMAGATQRYFSFELGENNSGSLTNIFSISLNMHIFLAFIILLLCETIGLWFLNTQLVFPENRLLEINVVYQLSLATLFFSVISIPYNALIISYEKMNVFAYITIFEVFAKLGVVYVLRYVSTDKLLVYSILIFFISFVLRLYYGIYCRYMFKDCRYILIIDKKKTCELLKYASWSLFGNIASVGYTQGINILLNIFFGPILNAANAIAMQVNNAITNFLSSFQMAINPQIVKSYASHNFEKQEALVFQGARFSFYLMLLLILPIITHLDYILSIWLDDYPKYTPILTALILINALINSLSGTVIILIQATGKIKIYQTVIGCILLLSVPISYLLFKNGFEPQVSYFVVIILSTICLFARLKIASLLGILSGSHFFKRVLIRCFCVLVCVCCFGFVIQNKLAVYSFSYFVIKAIIYDFIIIVFILSIGLTRREQFWILDKIAKIIKLKND